MTTALAFQADPGVKRDLLDRIERNLAAGNLVFADTAWDGERGSPLGVSIEGVDPSAYAQRYGYPVSLAALLDPLAAYPVDTFDAAAFVRDWVALVRPGADLSRVPARAMLFMLDDPRVVAFDPAITARLVALHTRDRDRDTPARGEWATVRQAILALPPAAPSPALGVIEASAWPAASGRSSLTSAFDAWRRLQGRIDDPAWSIADEARKEALLDAIWQEEAPARAAGASVDYSAILHQRDPDLAERFVANLNHVNALSLGAAARLATCVVDGLRSASIA